jgi:hypothetical protein
MSIDNREAVTALSNEVWTRALGSCCGREVARVDEVDLTGRCMPSGAALLIRIFERSWTRRLMSFGEWDTEGGFQ